ncbi:MAG: LysR substrate-binding domain-containing protein, partial [Nevskia sp.]|nr:LysR substrate-binding domain-containing protein [Nevskia sp.]
GQAMAPTPLARGIIEPVRRSLRDLEITLNQVARFDPATSQARFTIAVRDVLEATLLPALMERVAREAPQIEIAAVRADRRELESELAMGTLDAAIDVLLPLSEQIRHSRIGIDPMVVMARKGHPAVGGGLDLPTYLRQDHILVSSRRAGPGLEDVELSRHGHQRRIRLRCQHYFAACSVVSRTDLILTMPETYARIASQQFGNQILPFPLPMPTLDAHLYWHANVEDEPANRWLRERVVEVFKG